MHPWGQFGAQGPHPHGEGPIVGYCHHTGAWGRQEGKTGLVDCSAPAAMVPFSAFSSPSPSSRSSNPWLWHRSWCIRGENSPSWGPAPHKPPLPSSPSPPLQPHARGAAKGLRGFPPNLRPHVPAWIPVERSPPWEQAPIFPSWARRLTWPRLWVPLCPSVTAFGSRGSGSRCLPLAAHLAPMPWAQTGFKEAPAPP